MNAPEKTRRPWRRISLWILALLLAVAAVSLGSEIHRAQKQGIAVAALKGMGCSVGCDIGDDPATTLEWLRWLMREEESRSVTDVSGRNSQMTDAGMAHLQELPLLRGLNLDGTQVTDAGLVHLDVLTRLESLSLKGTQVTDAGLVHLQGLTVLGAVDLNGTKVTNAGVQQLQKALPNCYIEWHP